MESKKVNINNLEGDIHKHSLHLLQNWEKGVRYTLKGDKLKVVSNIFEKLGSYRRSNQNKIRTVISLTISNIDPTTEKLDQLFFKTLKPMSERIFDRGAISDQVVEILKKKAEALKKNIEVSSKVEDVRFALMLGVDLKPVSAGVNGTYFGRDRYGKRLIVFKPSDETALSGSSPKISSKLLSFLLRIFPAANPFLNINSKMSSKNEVIASIVDEILKFDVVPKTTLESFESSSFTGESTIKEGSSQEFIDGADLAVTKYKIPSYIPIILQKIYLKYKSNSLPHVTLKKFDEFVALDFIIGNQDRHFANFMIVRDTGAILAIDNGNSMPNRKPSRMIQTANQYTWAYLPEANRPFSKDVQEKIKSLDKTELFKKIKEIMGDGFTKEVQNEMNDRIEAINKVIDNQWNIASLGQFLRQKDFL